MISLKKITSFAHHGLLLSTLAAGLLLSACAQKQYIAIVAAPKSAEEQRQATAAAKHIFPVYHGQGFTYLKQELAKPEVRQKLVDKFTDKIDESSLGECLNNHGFSDYLTQRMLNDLSTEKLKDETIRLWVSGFPTDTLKKADTTFNSPNFKKIFLRMRDMQGKDIRSKLNTLLEQKFITDSEANEFILSTEDRDIKSFMIVSDHNVKVAISNLLAPYTNNPAGVTLDFMKTHPDANAACSILKGSSL